MRQRLVRRIFITFLLTFSLQGITDALIPEAVVPQDLKLRTSEPTREEETVSIATKNDIAISEIMYASNADKPSQWIELHNRSTRRVSLEGWEVTTEPLSVELSDFRPARDKMTGAVVITWSTQSELNNAGFFIKRSYQRDGEFKIINATLIPGAGTTREQQFYTYTDTTARPNVVYYYQLECVSVDGTRQTLTRSIRLKGHIGSSGRRIYYILWNN